MMQFMSVPFDGWSEKLAMLTGDLPGCEENALGCSGSRNLSSRPLASQDTSGDSAAVWWD